MIYLLYVLFFCIWILSIYRRYGFNISCFLISIYLIGSINCCLISYFYPDYIKFPERITLTSVSAHISLLWLFMYPLIKYANGIRIYNLRVSERALKIFALAIIIPSLTAILISFVDLSQIFLYGDLKKARTATLEGDISQSYVVNYGVIGYIPAFGTSTAFLALILFFYLKFYLKKFNRLANWLLICSFAMPLNNFTSVGRDGFVRWLLFFIACIILFKQHIDFKKNRKVFFIIGTLLLSTAVLFSMITVDRFKDSDNGVFFSLIRYGGEQFYLFSYGFHRFFDQGMTDFSHLFPIITQESFDMMNMNQRFRADYFLNTFPTFVGTFVLYLGYYKALILCICAFFFFSIAFWKTKKFPTITLTMMVGFIFYYEVVTNGFFYLMHGGRFVQGTIVIYISLAYLITHFRNSSKRQFFLTKAN